MKSYCYYFVVLALLMGVVRATAQSDEKTVVFTNTQGGEFAQQYGSRMDLLAVTLKGPITQEDLKALSNQYSLKVLNLEEGVIVAGKVGFTTYADNELCGCLGYLPLEQFTLPSTLKSIKSRAMVSNSAMLKNLYVTSLEPPLCPLDVFKEYSYQNCVLHVPANVLETYKSHATWGKFASIVGESNISGPVYTFTQEEFRLHHNEKLELTFNKELPEGARLKIKDANVAVLTGKVLYGDLVGETEITLTVNGETASAKVIVEPVSSKYVDPFIDWSMTKEQILEKLAAYPHKDTEYPSAGYDAVDFDFGNMGQKYVRYSFLKSTGKLESVIIAFISPVDYKTRDMDRHFCERFHLKLVKSELSKIFERKDVTLETFVTSSIAMASYKPTLPLNVKKDVVYCFETAMDIKKEMTLFIESSDPFAVDRGDGVEIAYEPKSYGFGKLKAVPVELASNTIKIYGGNITKIGLQSQKLTSLDLPAKSSLQFLHVGGNQLKSLNVESASGLEHLVCSNNEITALDLKKNKELKYLSAYMNFLNDIQVDGLSKLEVLYVNQTLIKNINLTGCDNLVQFWIDDTGLKQLTMPERYDHLRALFLRNCRLSVDALEQIFDKLPDVNNEIINSDNEVWMRRVKIARTPNVAGIIHLDSAEKKGWIFDVEGVKGIEELELSDAFKLYPSIATDYVMVETDGKPSRAYIFDLNGVCVKQLFLHNSLQQIDLSDMEAGVYFLKIESRDSALRFDKK